MTVTRHGSGAECESLLYSRSSRPRPRGWSVLALAMFVLLPAVAHAESFLRSRHERSTSDTSRAARDEAVRSIPYAQLDRAARAKVDSVLSDTAIFRRLPAQVIQCNPEMYLFLVEHPDVIVSIWKTFGITQLAVREIAAETYRVVDAAGTEGTMELLHASHDTHVFYAEGNCEGPVLSRPIHGRLLAVLRNAYVQETDGQPYVTCRLDAFLQVDRAGVEFVTKTLQPMFGPVVDLNFAQTAAFVGSLSRTAETTPSRVVRLASKLGEVQPPVREQFAALAEHVAATAAQRGVEPAAKVAEQPGGSVR